MTRKTPEGRFKAELQEDLKELFPGCVLIKNDEQAIQGIPDLLLLHEDFWAMFEVKESATAAYQPNQAYYIDLFNQMSFAAFVYPENKDEILHAVQSAYRAIR